MEILKKAVASILSIGMVIGVAAFAGCTPEENAENEKPERWNTPQFVVQTESAENTYNSIYAGVSGSNSAPVKTSRSALTKTAPASDNSSQGASLQDILSIFDKYNPDGSTNIDGNINSYIGDIFSYSQIQLSLIDEYESEALVGTYNIDYSNVIWEYLPDGVFDMDINFLLGFLQSTKPLTARFIGVDPTTNKTYISQTHKVVNNDVRAKLEYFYDNQTNDMGVTTLNWHYSGDTGAFSHFEYHYCDPMSDLILYANGELNESDELEITRFTLYTQKGMYRSNYLDDDDNTAVSQYILSEVSRIESTMHSVEELNSQILLLADDFEAPAEPRTLTVSYDFSILYGMIRKDTDEQA